MSLLKLDSTTLCNKTVYDTNRSLRDITDLMENEQFRTFFNKHSNPKVNWESITMFMHLYSAIDKRYPGLDKYQKTEAMKKLIDDTEYRKIILSEYLKLN